MGVVPKSQRVFVMFMRSIAWDRLMLNKMARNRSEEEDGLLLHLRPRPPAGRFDEVVMVHQGLRTERSWLMWNRDGW